MLRGKFPKLGTLMDEAENDVLAFITFPRAHWAQIYSTNPLERLNAEIKRRTNVVGIRKRIEATVVRRAPQVMVKVTGGGRGMKAIAAHFRYISKNGRLDIEDERGETMRGKDTLARPGR